MGGGSITLSESDLALVNALQIWPRAPWSVVARSLGTRADAASRRWARLRARGDAWMTAYFGARTTGMYCVAIVSVRCSPGGKEEVAEELVRDACCVSVEITAGAHDIVLTVSAQDLEALHDYLAQRLERTPGVTATSTSLVTHLHSEGTHWRLHALEPSAHDLLQQQAEQLRPAETAEPDELDRRLAALLSVDGRASCAALARAAGTSTATARRRIAAMLRSRVLSLRCDVAAPLVGLPVTATIRGRVRPDRAGEVAAGLAGLPQVRLCATLTGEHNLLATVWVRSVGSIQRLEQSLSRKFPGFDLHHTLVNLRTPKRMGRLLDRSGRASGHVPMAPRTRQA
ncbi:Lrp/AsnC family transcriptional regulator [Salinifilum ghardaiensis]